MANDITTAAKKGAVLLSLCGTAMYMIHSMVTPEKPTEGLYVNLTNKVREHFLPRPSPIVQHFKFNTCVSQPGEKIVVYVVRL